MKSTISTHFTAPSGGTRMSGTKRKLTAAPLDSTSCWNVSAAQQRVDGDEERDLEQERKAGGERVDAVLLVEREHLALLALAVVLVLLLDGLELRRHQLHPAHRLDPLQRQRQRERPHGQRQADDRQAPAQADRLREELDDRLGEVDERLEDDEDGERVMRPPRGHAARAGLVVAKQAPIGELVDAAGAPGLQRTTLHTARIVPGPPRARAPPAPRTSSSSGNTGSAASRFGEITPDRVEREQEGLAQQASGRGGGGRAFHVLRRPDPGFSEQFPQRAVDAGRSLTLNQTSSVGPGHQHVVVIGRQAASRGPRRPRAATA